MNYQALSKFFMWCTILSMGILILWTSLFACCADWLYEMHSHFFLIPREKFNTIIYAFIGLFKILALIFNLIPWCALLILKQKQASGRI